MNKESEEKADDNGESKKSKSEIDSTRDLAKLIPEEVQLILDDLPDEKRQVIIKSLSKFLFQVLQHLQLLVVPYLLLNF